METSYAFEEIAPQSNKENCPEKSDQKRPQARGKGSSQNGVQRDHSPGACIETGSQARETRAQANSEAEARAEARAKARAQARTKTGSQADSHTKARPKARPQTCT
jgi:FKBP-type peptidyl-prolyl cis-trans isomerase